MEWLHSGCKMQGKDVAASEVQNIEMSMETTFKFGRRAGGIAKTGFVQDAEVRRQRRQSIVVGIGEALRNGDLRKMLGCRACLHSKCVEKHCEMVIGARC